MNNWRTLYFYELKKILQKRFTIVALIAIYAFSIFAILSNNMGTTYINNFPYMKNAELLKIDVQNERALSGKKIDGSLIEETLDKFREYQALEESFGENLTQEQMLLLADAHIHINRPYSSILDYCRTVLGMSGNELLAWEGGEQAFYSGMKESRQKNYDVFRLTKGEIDYWEEKYEQLEKPVTFQYCGGYKNLLASVYAASAMLMFFVGIALCGIFSDERMLGCDQLLLSSKNGRKLLYSVKLAAGLSVAAAATAGLTAIFWCMDFWIYGADGFHGVLQLIRPLYPYPISVGQFAIIIFGMLFLVILLVGIMVMFLSICVSRSTISLAVVISGIIVGLFFNIPKRMRILSQIWDWLPVNCLFAGNIYDLRLFPFGGWYLTSWQILPVFYGILAVIFVVLGKRIYENGQVRGR